MAIISNFYFFIKLKKYEKIKNETENQYKKLLNQKKSSEVVLGQISEKLVPFLKEFKYDAQKANFLGNPIDYIIFEEEEIIFMEIKSGNSALSQKQRKIKKLVNDKKIRWEEIKIK
jgi:predicted Holliday junction resolvase-like endonuclease